MSTSLRHLRHADYTRLVALSLLRAGRTHLVASATLCKNPARSRSLATRRKIPACLR